MSSNATVSAGLPITHTVCPFDDCKLIHKAKMIGDATTHRVAARFQIYCKKSAATIPRRQTTRGRVGITEVKTDTIKPHADSNEAKNACPVCSVVSGM